MHGQFYVSGLLVLALATACGRGPNLQMAPAPVAEADSIVRVAMADEGSLDVTTVPMAAVGVLPFQTVTEDSSLAVLGYGLADLLMTDLSRSKQLMVVDRLRINALLHELALAEAGVTDTSSAPRFGRLLGARRMVMGSVVIPSIATSGRLEGLVGDVATGRIRTTGARATNVTDILEDTKALAFGVFDQLDVTLTPAERSAIEQRPGANLAALLAYSRGVRAEYARDFRSAARHYREAIRHDRRFENARARLSGVEPLLEELGQMPLGTGGAGGLAVGGLSGPVVSRLPDAAEPAFRQQVTTMIIIIVSVP